MLEIYEEDIEKLDSGTPIARYFSVSKLTKLLRDESLYFCNSKRFQDNHERTLPDNIYWRYREAKRIAGKISDYQKQIYEAYISCWTKFDSENYALWKTYDKYSNGVCLVTTVGGLKAQLPKNVLIGPVTYIPVSGEPPKINIPMVHTSQSSNYIATEFFKIYPYKYENEIRAVFYDRQYSLGESLPVNLKELITEVYISPFSNEERKEKTKNLLMRKFDINIIKESFINETNKN